MCVTSVACEWNRVFYDPFVLGLTLVSERSNAWGWCTKIKYTETLRMNEVTKLKVRRWDVKQNLETNCANFVIFYWCRRMLFLPHYILLISELFFPIFPYASWSGGRCVNIIFPLVIFQTSLSNLSSVGFVHQLEK